MIPDGLTIELFLSVVISRGSGPDLQRHHALDIYLVEVIVCLLDWKEVLNSDNLLHIVSEAEILKSPFKD